VKHSADEHNFHYQGASYYVLLELFKKLPSHLKNKNFIDFGSGKGRALFCAEYSGFNELTGVELDKDLVDIANENVKLYKQKRKESHFTFICSNVLNYVIPENSAVFYFFNPFSETIMLEVEKKISDYQAVTKEEIYIVYVNPKFDSVWKDAGYDIFYRDGNNRYTEALIFRRV
jgi:16S rRNA G966 N2-methylase RsmD